MRLGQVSLTLLKNKLVCTTYTDTQSYISHDNWFLLTTGSYMPSQIYFQWKRFDLKQMVSCNDHNGIQFHDSIVYES